MAAARTVAPLTALLVESNPHRRQAVMDALARGGFTIAWQTMEEPAAFARAVRVRCCDVLFVGQGSGGFGAIQALDIAKRESPETQVVVLAEPHGEEAVVELYRHGASDCVLYPGLDRLVPAMARALREREERAGRRRGSEALAFSARASTELATSLDFDTTVERVARLAVPFLADYCGVDVIEEGRLARRSECALDDFPSPLAAALGSAAALPGESFWAGRPQALPTFAGTDAPTGADLRALNERGLASLVRLPLRAQGRALGVLTLAGARPRMPQTAASLRLAEDFAHRASLSLDAARLHQQLQRTDQRKDEFLAMLAHELRNPLASILAGIEVVKARAETGGIDRPLLTAERQAKHMARILDDLLDLSRITRGKIELRRQPTELNALVQDAIQAAQSRAQARGLTLSVEPATDGLPLHADPDRVEQVLANLLANGIKFTRPGGHLWVTTTREGSEAIVRVRDSGMGIDGDTLPRIFDLFVQGNPSLDRAEGGLGLGLTLVRKLTELHGGTVGVTSDGPGRGTEFTVRLPLAVGIAALPPTPLEMPHRGRHPLRVLLVDDNEDLRQSTAELVRLLDHEVVEAADGDEAVRRVEREPFDVLLLDLGLPGLDGYAVAKAVRSMEEGTTRRAALIALTGYSQPEHRRRALQAGFDEHLTKPLDFDQLRELLARVGPRAESETLAQSAPL